jgi:hypothetical protein
MNARTERVRLVLLLGAGLLLLQSGPARAQSRPSLEKMQAAICAKADVDGDSYRPVFCPPSCSCSTNEPYGAGTVCEELVAGDYQVSRPEPYTPQCRGVCATAFGVVYGSCRIDADCDSGSTCTFSYGRCAEGPGFGSLCANDVPCGFVAGACSLDSTGQCMDEDPCSSDADCDYAGFSCDTTLGYCTSGSCTGPGSCSAGTKSFVYLSLTNVTAPGTLTAADCSGQPVNSNDAAACLAQVESVLGQSCTPLP